MAKSGGRPSTYNAALGQTLGPGHYGYMPSIAMPNLASRFDQAFAPNRTPNNPKPVKTIAIPDQVMAYDKTPAKTPAQKAISKVANKASPTIAMGRSAPSRGIGGATAAGLSGPGWGNMGPGSIGYSTAYGHSNLGGTPSMGNAFSTTSLGGPGGGGAGGGSSVLCMYFAQKGWLDWSTYVDLRTSFTYPHEVRVGYLTWAIPLVVWLRQQSLAAKLSERFIWPFVRLYARGHFRPVFIGAARLLGRALLRRNPNRTFAFDRLPEFGGT